VFPQPQEEQYHDGLNEALLGRVPATAKRIVEVGCARGRLGYELKQRDPERYVVGVEMEPDAAAVARTRLDEVHILDIQEQLLPMAAGSIDCVIFGDVLEHLVDPEQVLRDVRPLLKADGLLLACIPNVAHWTVLMSLLRSDLMYQPSGLLDATHLRFFTHATIFKLLLDAGFLPDREAVITKPVGDRFMTAASPLLRHVRMHPKRGRGYLEAHQYVVSGRLLPEVAEPFAGIPITFVACVNDDLQSNSNLLRSPCLQPGTPHEIVLMRGQSSAAQGFNAALDRARHDLVVFVQQDMYLPRGWDSRFVDAFDDAERRFAPLGVAGAFGLTYRDGVVQHVGRVVDRDRLLDKRIGLPAPVDGLDEILLAMRRDTPLRFDESLGFHMYGTDLCLTAQEKGMSSVVLDVPCYHNSLFAEVSADFHASRDALLAKWPNPRPLYNNMGRLDTMATTPAPKPEEDRQKELLARKAQELAAARQELAAAKARIARMEASAFWKARSVTQRLLRRG
jgi:SAM-dependent methyltransferase